LQQQIRPGRLEGPKPTSQQEHDPNLSVLIDQSGFSSLDYIDITEDTIERWGVRSAHYFLWVLEFVAYCCCCLTGAKPRGSCDLLVSLAFFAFLHSFA